MELLHEGNLILKSLWKRGVVDTLVGVLFRRNANTIFNDKRAEDAAMKRWGLVRRVHAPPRICPYCGEDTLSGRKRPKGEGTE